MIDEYQHNDFTYGTRLQVFSFSLAAQETFELRWGPAAI